MIGGEFADYAAEVATVDWAEYERGVFEELRSRYKAATITHDARLPGRYSKTDRQIDTLIVQDVADSPVRVVVDAKYFKSRIDVKDVEMFLGLMADVSAHQGLMVSLEGYSAAALNRAWNDPADVDLDIFSLAELKAYQAFGAIPFAGSNGVFLRAPFGWVVDVRHGGGVLAYLYQRGRDLADAQARWEWAYVSFWAKDEKAADLDALCKLQDERLRKKDAGVEITYLSGPSRSDARTRIRRSLMPGYEGIEFTGYVEFGMFMFFCVLFSPHVREGVNLRKLRGILREVKPLDIRHKEPPVDRLTARQEPWLAAVNRVPLHS